ncbi:DUF302 domain-containing protein [Henriciella litoralis]|uniref:DUF302 domain-containing protein n=1 Tax=Henriciella litoralis TaxID=568102 RepID=UPI000A06F1C2|nr:DUF302 domain-containing protein [Henriciella litoralis]
MKHSILAAIAGASILASACATNPELENMVQEEAAEQPSTQAIIAAQSASDFATTVDQLRAALESRPLTIFATVEHAEGARKAGLSLSPSTLFIFGNPKSGAPLMQANPALGIELPMKILVIETDQGVQVIRQDIFGVLQQYGVSPENTPAAKMDETLAAIVAEATQ